MCNIEPAENGGPEASFYFDNEIFIGIEPQDNVLVKTGYNPTSFVVFDGESCPY